MSQAVTEQEPATTAAAKRPGFSYRALGLLLLGIAVGGLVMAGGYYLFRRMHATGGSPLATGDGQVWTCSMHPQVRLNRPGKCPICGTDLIPVKTEQAPELEDADHSQHAGEHLSLSEHARRMARVETAPVEARELVKELRLVGRIEPDETRVRHITARVAGRVDQVYADFTGTVVREGDHLVKIYSPDLYATQEEFLIALRRERERAGGGARQQAFSLTSSARRRLELWGLTEQQLQELAESGQAQTHLTVYAPLGGTVIEKDIREGEYVREGDSLYTIADLSYVWLILEVYESELSWPRFGQAVDVMLEGMPARPYTGSVAFVEPVLNEATRTVRVRVILRNDHGAFKPGMYAQASLQIPIASDGGPAPTGLEGRFACRMHPYIVADEPGDCTVCGMPLEQVPGERSDSPSAVAAPVLSVPAEAVLTTGRRRLVYVEQQPGEYRLVEPKLGPRAGDFYPLLGGLVAGDRVVLRGNFLLDSQFQISGKPSLLYPEGIRGGGAAHVGHGAAQPAEAPPATQHQH